MAVANLDEAELPEQAVNSVAVVVNLDFITIRRLRRASLHHPILQESLRLGIHCAELMSAAFIP
jgi:hypothetical protein